MRVRTGVLQELYNLTLYVCVMLWMNIFFLSLYRLYGENRTKLNIALENPLRTKS